MTNFEAIQFPTFSKFEIKNDSLDNVSNENQDAAEKLAKTLTTIKS